VTTPPTTSSDEGSDSSAPTGAPGSASPVARGTRLLGFRPDAPRRNVLLTLGYLLVALAAVRLLGGS
jgi:hypothetical protein